MQSPHLSRGAAAVFIGALLLAGCGQSLQHGKTFVLALQTDAPAANSGNSLLEAKKILGRRLGQLKVPSRFTDIIENQLTVQVTPPTNGLAIVRRLLTAEGSFAVHLVHPKSADLIKARTNLPDYELRQFRQQAPGGGTFSTPMLVKKEVERGLTGKYIKHAFPSPHPVTGQSELVIELDSEGSGLLAAITQQYKPAGNNHYQLAILLDGEIVVAPFIMEPIEGGKIVIGRAFTASESTALAAALENPLAAPLRIIQEENF